MILFSVSDSSMDSQMASAACPAAPEMLLMASSSCERIGDRSRRGPRATSATTADYPFESGTRLI
jgi:hypothetical protein